MLLAMGFEMKYHDDYVNLRQNFVNSDYGKFELEDFKWMNQDGDWLVVLVPYLILKNWKYLIFALHILTIHLFLLLVSIFIN